MVDRLVSVIYACCNQRDWVRKTIPLAIAALGKTKHEIIVIDDQSIDGCCKGLPSNVLIIRTPERLGCSRSRRIGVSRASGDVLLFSDPHCEYEGDLGQLCNSARQHPWIWQPKSKRTPASRRVRQGGAWQISTRGLVVGGNYDGNARHKTLIDTVYAVRRDVYDSLGGWPELPGVWGYSEQGLSLAAWFAGVPVVVDDSMTIVHYDYHVRDVHGKGRFSYSVRPSDQAINAHAVHSIFFPETYESYWRPMLDNHFGDTVDTKVITEALRTKMIRRQCAAARQPERARRTERQFFEHALMMPYPLDVAPTDEEFIKQQAKRSKPGKYKGIAPRRIERAIDWFVAKIPGCLRGRTVLDLGCRDGHGVLYALKRHARMAVGIEIVPEVAAYAKDKMQRPVVQGDMRHLSYADSTWDILISLHSLEHVPNPEAAVAEMVRVAKDRSWMLLAVPLETQELAATNPYSTAHNYYWGTADSFRDWVYAQPGIDKRYGHSKVVRISSNQHECRVAVRVTK